MLCFDSRYLTENLRKFIGGYVFNSGQPTTHFRVLAERGIDPRRVIVDEAAPLYHVGKNMNLPPIQLWLVEFDMENRLEQNQLLMGTLRHFGFPDEKLDYEFVKGYQHSQNCSESFFAAKIRDFILRQ